MQRRTLRRRGRSVAILGLAVGCFTSGLQSSAAAAPAAAISGQFSVFPVASASAPIQLLAGTSADLWFVTAGSQLGHISSTGVVSLLPVTIAHGNVPAKLVAADADGVWAFGDTTAATQSCTVSLVKPDGQVMQLTLIHPTGPVCNDGALDRNGNLWLSVHGGSSYYQTGVSRMAEISPSGTVTLFHPDRDGARPTGVALGSDGAIWALEFGRPTQFGRYTETPPATSVALGGNVPPPYDGSDFWGLVPRQLLARSDGTFWLMSGRGGSAIALSSPGKWLLRYLLPGQASVGAMSQEGSIWTVNYDRNGFPTQRLIRTDVSGRLDRTASLPAGAGGIPGSGGPLAAASDGSIWTVTANGSATFVVRFVPG